MLQASQLSRTKVYWVRRMIKDNGIDAEWRAAQERMSVPILDIDLGRELADEGIERSASKASPEWNEAAMDALDECARTMPDFTADDFWLLFIPMIARRGIEPANKSAAGKIFRRAASESLISRTDYTRTSQRGSTHCRPLPVWRSLVYRVF
jgi:hypothetical protein